MNNNDNVEEFKSNKNLTDDELVVLNDKELWKKVEQSLRNGGSNSRRRLPKS